MSNIITNILIGLKNFPFFAILFTVPIVVLPILHYKKINIVRIGINYLFLLYMLCLFALVFFPLPDFAQMQKLSSYDIQWVPFQFVSDIIKESPLVLSDPATYLPALTNKAIWQVVFNIVMLVPFGMFLRYTFKMSVKKTVICTFFLSLAIELTQFTGMFFLFNGSYRLCDVDDLMANTLGGFFGAFLMQKLSGIVPQIEMFDHSIARKGLKVKMMHTK